MDLDSVADELYGLDPRQFTATRNEREKQARARGQRELARKIHPLRKPTTVAWLANLLVRERGDEVQPLLELGAGLREAQETLRGDQLRRLSQQRHQLIAALVQQARALGRAAGHRVSDDAAQGLTRTLETALADPDAAEALRQGRLTSGLEYSGFGAATAVARPTKRPAGPEPTAPGAGARALRRPDKKDAAARRRERRDRARRERDEARREERAAHAARDDAERRTRDAAARRDAATDEVRRLGVELDHARERASALDREAHAQHRATERAERAARDARRRLDAAEAALAQLGRDGN